MTVNGLSAPLMLSEIPQPLSGHAPDMPDGIAPEWLHIHVLFPGGAVAVDCLAMGGGPMQLVRRSTATAPQRRRACGAMQGGPPLSTGEFTTSLGHSPSGDPAGGMRRRCLGIAPRWLHIHVLFPGGAVAVE